MTTLKQGLAIQNMVENGGNMSKAMIDAGYSFNTAKTPQKLTDSKVFKELCEEHGLTENFLLDALVEDIKNKVGNRKAELELGFKIRGRLMQKHEVDTNYRPIPIVSLLSESDKENLQNLIE